MEGSKTLFCSYKFSCVREWISSKIIDSLDTGSQNVSTARSRVSWFFQVVKQILRCFQVCAAQLSCRLAFFNVSDLSHNALKSSK
jgi:hypothetical protein